jgi:hypothetical protein
MRYLGILLLIWPLSIFAQPAEADSRTLQTLLAEVQQLRLAIERSTLLGARTQLAISQLQLQEARAARIGQEHSAARDVLAATSARKTQVAAAIRDMESSAKPGLNLEGEIKGMNHELVRVTAEESRFAARESELASQLQAAQRDVQDSRNWIAEMQRSLDNAIQQMLRPR